MDTLLKKIINETVNQRFPEMSTESRDLLCTIITRREMEKGELLLKEGQVSRHFVIVGKGMVRQFYYKNGKDVTEHFSLESDVVICIESILLQQPTRLMIEALEAGTLYMIPADQFLKLSKESWEINMFYRKMLEFSLILSSGFLALRNSPRTLSEADGRPARSRPARPLGAHSFLPAHDSGDPQPGARHCPAG